MLAYFFIDENAPFLMHMLKKWQPWLLKKSAFAFIIFVAVSVLFIAFLYTYPWKTLCVKIVSYSRDAWKILKFHYCFHSSMKDASC